jgi:hypothetical protein
MMPAAALTPPIQGNVKAQPSTRILHWSAPPPAPDDELRRLLPVWE